MKSCVVFGCHHKAGKKGSEGISFYRLPLKNKELLKKWLAALKTDSVPVNSNSRVCSAHFEGGKRTGMDDVPSVFSFSKAPPKRKAPAVRIAPPPKKKDIESGPDVSAVESSGAEPDKNRLLEGKLASVESELERCRARVKELEEENVILRVKSRSFCYDVIKEDDGLVRFYTGLPDSAAFGELFYFVEDSVEDLVYWSGSKTSRRESTSQGKRNPTRTLSCPDELLMTLINCDWIHHIWIWHSNLKSLYQLCHVL